MYVYAHMSACIFYYYYHYYYEDNIEEKEQSLKLVWKGSVSNFILLAPVYVWSLQGRNLTLDTVLSVFILV